MQIQLTDVSQAKIQSFLDDHGDREGSVTSEVAELPGSCSGFQYGLSIEDAPDGEDEILRSATRTVLTDPPQEKAPLSHTPSR